MVQVSDLEKQFHDQKDEIAKLQATVAQLKSKQIQNHSVSKAVKQKNYCTVCIKSPGKYPCRKCTKVFSCQNALKTHFKAIQKIVEEDKAIQKIVAEDKAFNAKTKLFECLKCKKSFKTTYDLSQHVKNPPKLHFPEEHFENRVFNTKSKTFDCARCDKKFNLLQEFKHHFTTSHSISFSSTSFL